MRLRNQLRRTHRQSRKEVFETVHALSKEGLTCSEIARRTGYGRRSIAKWLTFETPPDRRRGALQPTSPLYFEAFLTQCWKDGNRRGRHLFHDIKHRGYTGSFSNLERLLATWRRAERPESDKDKDKDKDDAFCIEKVGDEWLVYYSERGAKRELGWAKSEGQALNLLKLFLLEAYKAI